MKLHLEQADLAEPEVIIRGNTASDQVQNLIGLLNRTQSPQKMFFSQKGRDYIFDIGSVSFFEAFDNRISAMIDGARYEAGGRLYELEHALAFRGFVRISKGILVNVNHISAVEAEFSGNYTVLMKDGARLTLSRRYVKAFKKYIMEEY